LPVGWFWFLGTLVPVIGIVQVGGQAIADRYTYIPSIGIFIIVAFGAAELLQGWEFRKAALTITASAIILLLLIQTGTQVRYWQNSISLFEHTLAVTRNNSMIHYNLGRAYQLANIPDKAIENYLEALRLQPEDADVHNNLGMLLRNQNKLDEAITHFRKAIEINPRFAAAYSNLGRTLQLQGKFDEAIECLNRSLELEPDRPERLDALAAICIKAGKTKQAVESSIHACQLTGNSDPYYLDTLASAYAAEGNFTEAVETAEKAQKLAEFVGDKKLAEDLQRRLQLYKQGRLAPKE
jgi:tetratricopeptide (TPR) repeat protein